MAEETPVTALLARAAPPSQLQDVLAETQVQADEGFDDAASEASASYVTSLNSSVFHYRYENGRRYHAFREGAYLVPNDDEEQSRMDLVHHIYRLMLGGKLCLAPVGEHVHRVLDLGTGTGIWAMDFADEHPSAEVLGTDLSPIQPKWIPPNCVFEVDDFESDWTYRRPFDFIIGRELEGCLADDALLVRRAFDHLVPGGYLEMQAVYPQFASDDDTAKLAVDATKWMRVMVESAARFGKPWDVAGHFRECLEAAGFVDVQQKVLKLPIGGWPKDPTLKQLGKCQLYQELQVLEAYTPGLLSRVLGWTPAAIEVFLAQVRKDIQNPAIHLYLPVYFVWGRKP